MRLRAMVAVAAVLAFSGCTQPDGMPDFSNPEDPDNLIILDDEDYAAGIAAAAAFGLAVVLGRSACLPRVTA